MAWRFAIFLVAAVLSTAKAMAAFDAAVATNNLGLNLYRTLAEEPGNGNLLLSPYSIESALALAYAGADGATREEMAGVLHLPQDEAAVVVSFAKLRAALEAGVKTSAEWSESQLGNREEAIEWHQADRLFGQRQYAFRSSFLELLKDGYDSPFEPLDFRNHPEQARSTINSWVAGQTRDRIRDLIPTGGVNAATRLVLVNAIYLKAQWNHVFNKRLTALKPFLVHGSISREVPTMFRPGRFGYSKGDGFTAVAVPYIGGDLEFLILVPDAGIDVDTLARGLTPETLRSSATGFKEPMVRLFLPKFRIAGPSISLGRKLQELGMKSAFDIPPHSANFDRIASRTPNDYLFLSEVIHKTFISLDENGTEAAAATADMMVNGMALDSRAPIEVHVDRPFLFAIRLRSNGLCLFLGRVTDPQS
jgi:serpin B